MQAAGHGVAAPAELAAGVQDGHNHLDRGDAFGWMEVNGDAASVVRDPDAAVGLQDNLNVVAVTGQRLIDGVVHHFIHQVVQAAGAGGTDVHAGTLADGLEAFQNGDLISAVLHGGGIFHSGVILWCYL